MHAVEQFCVALDNPHGHSAVDDEVFSGDEVIFNQGPYQRGNILRPTLSVQRNAVLDIVLCLCGGKRIMKGSANYTGRDAVDTDALIGEFAAQDAGELRQSAFHDTIGECAEAAA